VLGKKSRRRGILAGTSKNRYARQTVGIPDVDLLQPLHKGMVIGGKFCSDVEQHRALAGTA
jgi:hypothetical protein